LTTGFVGKTGIGSVTVNSGSALLSMSGHLGDGIGSSGTVAVDGNGSTWTSGNSLFVGGAGTGILNITNGGLVVVQGGTAVAPSVGSINFGANGGTLTTLSFYGLPAQLSGTGTVNTFGIVTDDALLFDATHGTNQTLTWASAQENVTVHLDLSGASGSVTNLGVGYQATGTMTIRDGTVVTCGGSCYLGYEPGSMGVASVDGSGSIWACNSFLYVGNGGMGGLNINDGGKVSSSTGHVGAATGSVGTVTVDGSNSSWTCSSFQYIGEFGTGTLMITNGGNVRNSSGGYLGYSNGATGTATVDGSGSTWISSSFLSVGNSGTGTLKISNGGMVTAVGVSVSKSSLVALQVGDGSALSAGAGILDNAGVIRLSAVAGLASASYTPITATSWSGSGAVAALGGSWDSTTHVFKVTAATTGLAGEVVTIDQLLTQRMAITDAAAKRSVWAGFQGTPSSSILTLTATMLTDAQEAALQESLTDGSGVLEGWNFTTSGYTAGNPVALSVELGAGYSTDVLTVWHFDGAAWTPYTTTDLSYDGKYANFTVTSFSGYAVTGPVPVPEGGTLGVLVVGMVKLVRRRRRV
jgi:T5SS/PEP-CTERM-associated repeat protein